MRGRELFRIAAPIINLYRLFLKPVPAGVLKWLLVRLRYSRGYHGLALRYGLLCKLAQKCGANVAVHDCVVLRYPEKLRLGNNVSIHPFCYIDAQGHVEIGDDVSIAHNVSILSFEHDFSDCTIPIKDGPCIPQLVIIEDQVWIGAGVRVLGGIKIGRGSVLGAGAVVTRDIPPMSVAIGVPARVIKSRLQ
jgi:acetyltransferase-like isoleucine patch superfamily enzyme